MSTLTRKGAFLALLLVVSCGPQEEENEMSLLRKLSTDTVVDVQGGQKTTLFRGQTTDPLSTSYTVTISGEGVSVNDDLSLPYISGNMDRIFITHGFQNARRTFVADFPNSLTFGVHGSFLQIDVFNASSKRRRFKVIIAEGIPTVVTPLTFTVRSLVSVPANATRSLADSVPEGAYSFSVFRTPSSIPLLVTSELGLYNGIPAEPITYEYSIGAGIQGAPQRILPGMISLGVKNIGGSEIPRGNLICVFDIAI